MIFAKFLFLVSLIILNFFQISNSNRYFFNHPNYHNFHLQNFPSFYDTGKRQACYGQNGKAQRCDPPFQNVAYQRPIESTNTCGSNGPTEFCIQTSRFNQGPKQSCFLCEKDEHSPHFLNDFNDNNTQTWWQSDTMFDGIEYPKQVNITLHLGKSHDITYVRLLFQSPRPESFAIYKRENENSDWQPYQFYSGTCQATFNRTESHVASGDETRALCNSDSSDISPLSGGNVVFITLEGRPSIHSFESHPGLQKFVTATDIRIVLVRHNTFGDEVFRDPGVLKSYYYAIADLSVGGRCKCNGHASECIFLDGNPYGTLKCKCEHNTTGIDCERCQDFYNDQPWAVATKKHPHECKACNCNNRSNRCFFDQALWEKTGHGGHCLNCIDNTDGPNCEKCKEGYYETSYGRCLACACNKTGSFSSQCNSKGECPCKPGISGNQCDRCQSNYYDFTEEGCKSCECSESGSLNNTPLCNPNTGKCVCKDNTEGKKCDKCKPGYFNLHSSNEFGCLSCFCFGHSSVCSSAPGYFKYSIESLFTRDAERWTAKDRFGNMIETEYGNKGITIRTLNQDTAYFLAPGRFLGDQKASYNQFLTFNLRIGEEGPRTSYDDIVLEGSGLKISQPIFGQGNPLPNLRSQLYQFKLHENSMYDWSPKLSSKDFISILANLTAIKIRGVYTYRGIGFINEVRLESAQQLPFGDETNWVETCECPDGYIGQFCESCAPGFKHDPAGGGPYATCVPCNCNNHSKSCDPESGRCICEDNTDGANCETCARGFYGNAMQGSEKDCQPCPCPNQGACIVLPDESIACLECPEGYAGARCDLCVDGYFGDPQGKTGAISACEKCNCNGNIDENAVGNCDTKTGECYKCVHNTHGKHCEKCLPGYFGNALALPFGNCSDCGCHSEGTYESDSLIQGHFQEKAYSCNQKTGQCNCKPYIKGRQCDQCIEGYWNIFNEGGCQPCDCDLIGSFNKSCDTNTGQCYCRPGIVGQKCDTCERFHYGFSEKGCSRCDCDPIGSDYLNCTEHGQCLCKENVEGRRCERCRENTHNRQDGCRPCPHCYNLVQDALNLHREKLNSLRSLLFTIQNKPMDLEDPKKFDEQLKEIVAKVSKLRNEARDLASDQSLVSQLEGLKDQVNKIEETVNRVAEQLSGINLIVTHGAENVSVAEQIIKKAEETLSMARKILDTDGLNALQQAREKSKLLGQHSAKMSQIANQSRTLAKELEEQAQDIVKTINEALNYSQEAYKLSRETIFMQRSNKDEIRNIQRQLDSASDLLKKTMKMAADAKNEAEKAYNESLAVFSDASQMTIPHLESEKVKQEANFLIDEANRIIQEADQLLDQNQGIFNKTKYQIDEARELLQETSKQRKNAEGLFFEANTSLEKAKEVVASVDKTLNEATETRNTLIQFDEVVLKSQSEAEEAFARVPSIERLIKNAQVKTEEAEKSLKGAEVESFQAKKFALDARNSAENASQSIARIQEVTMETKKKTKKAKQDILQLNDTLKDTDKRIETYEKQAEIDGQSAGDALEKSTQAKTLAEEAKSKIESAIKIVNEIVYDLDHLDDVDSKVLSELEQRLNEAEEQMKSANLENQTQSLLDSRANQERLIKNYSKELEKLIKDVANIKQISETIPETCYRRISLEP